ncbi:M15 family metallopeptidase [Xanthobacter agilis]|uniref:Peptidase M15C domain-containing protein n=1 Tax=Xanthobacter agilis TaxID=47492 RepID=A0ABU0LJV1_XANAG|nr:M15 family metallopeptidase [Xanthobacter agilis]MDQ0507413.1 hypothetical protein [Xanthobacter agilis]
MAQTIEEYVIALGLKVDKAQEQRFNSALDNLGKTFAWMAAGLTAAAATIQATVVAVSKSFDNLYFAAQRTNSTVAGIKSLSYAFTQIGGTADEAMGAISGLAKAMRTNPGVEKWLNAQGIKTAGKDVKQILMDAADVFAKKDYAISNQFAEMIGIPEETWNKWVKNKDQIRKFEAEQEAAQRRFGVDPKKAAESSNELMTRFRGLKMELWVLFEKITVALQPQLNQLMADIAKWFEEHQEQIVKILNQVLEAVKGLIADFGELLKALRPVVDKFAEMVKLLTGDENSLKVALEVLTGVTLAAFIAKWALFLASLAGSSTFLALVALTGAGAYGYLMVTRPQQETIGASIGGPATEIEGGGTLWGKYGPGGWYWKGKGSPTKRNRGLHGDGGGSAPRAGLAPVKTKDGRVAWVDEKYQGQFQGFVNDLEETGYQIKDIGGFADRANVNNPSQKSKHAYGMAIDINPDANPNGSTRTDLPSGTGALAEKWGLGWGMNWKSTKDPMHFSTAPNEGGRQMSPDELKALQDEQATRLKDKQSELFGAPALGASSARMASINNRTSITVYGSSDPAGTAANLNGAQSRVASELIRNGQSAFV